MKLDRFSDRVQRAFSAAQTYANDLGHGRVMPAHVLVALLADKDGISRRILARLGADASQLERRVNAELARLRIPMHGAPTWDVTLEEIARLAEREGARDGDGVVRSQHLLVAIADAGPGAGKRALNEAGVTRSAIRFALRELGAAADQERAGKRGLSSPEPVTPENAPGATRGPRAARPTRSESRQKPGEDTEGESMLERFGRDLTAMARSGELDPIVGRDLEIRRLMQILGRRTKNNPIVIGESGVGKTAIVEGFAYRLVSDDVPFGLKGRRLVEIDLAALVAGTTLRGQFEERIKRLVAEVAASNGQVILYIDEIHSLVDAGGRGGSGGAADMLKPALARGEVTLIGTTTPGEYRAHIESDKALERRFQELVVEEPSEEEAIAILRGIKERYEIHHRVRILDSAIQAAVRLSERYVLERKLPDKAVDLIDEAAARLRMQVDSEPAEVYALKQRVGNLELQRAALAKDSGAAARKEIDEIDALLTGLRKDLEAVTERLHLEKSLLDRISEIKAELEASRKLADQAHAEGDLGRAAELKYSVIKHLEDELAAKNAELDALHGAGRLVREEVSEEDIAVVVGDWTGIPTTKMLESERQKLLAFGERLQQRVIGQPQAVDAIAAAVRRSRAGLQERDRPIGNFFFVGPTGVGKTELAKALAESLFDSEDALIRIDMSEYMEQSKVNTLIGAAYGYVDSDKGGILTEAVRRRPYSVVLFDEAEKAHPDVFNILLQVLDEGRLSDSQGRRIDFTNTIIIMTSNVGAREILDLTGKVPYEELDERVHRILQDHFKPEFLNRLDDTVVFNALDRAAMEKIAAILIRKLRNLLGEQGLDIAFTPEALSYLIDVGYQPEYGARPLKRALLTEVQDPLAVLVLEGRFRPGDVIEADLAPAGDALEFSVKSV
jgi:ATP-dependent Clp protease ATP-binding subunit ClpB